MKTLEEIQHLADAGDAEAQYNLSVHYLNEGNDEKAYQYCYEAVMNGFTYANRNLALMYMEPKAPVWDAIAADNLLSHVEGLNAEEMKAIRDIQEDLLSRIETYRPYARANSILPLDEVPVIDGVGDAIKHIVEAMQQGAVGGALCGRLGSISRYPMIEIKRARDFQSVAGLNVMDNPSDGICFVLTFVQPDQMPTKASLEEAYWYMTFKELDIFKEFARHLSLNVRNNYSGIANIWEYTLDCGYDFEKAERIASSILYHLYGYKKGPLFPPIACEPYFELFAVHGESRYEGAALLYHNIEQFNKVDAFALVVGYIVCAYLYINHLITLGSAIAIAAIGTLVFFYYGAILTSKFKKMKYPKRNYIRFLRNPSTEW